MAAICATAALGIGSLAAWSGGAATYASDDPEPMNLPAAANLDNPLIGVAAVRGTDATVTYEIVDGMAILEGDIVLGLHVAVEAFGIDPLTIDSSPHVGCGVGDGQLCGVIDATPRRSWVNGVVPYDIAAGTSAAAAANIDNAIDEWETKTAITFVPRTAEADYVSFVGTGSGNTCSSWLGRIGGRQEVNYAGDGLGCLVHEIGHAVGLLHEQNRNDRDDYINIDFSNLSSLGAAQFQKAVGAVDVGTYDFRSAMHYGPYSFALDRSRPVITPKDPSIPLSDIGGFDVLTASDVQAVDFVYGDDQPPPTTTPPTTAPPAKNRAAIVRFTTLEDGGTIAARAKYGDIAVVAFDRDVGTADGDGIRYINLTIRDAATDEFISVVRRHRPLFRWSARLEVGRTYKITASARSKQNAGDGWRSTSVIVTAT